MSIFFTTLSLYLYVNTISKVQQLFEKPVEAEMKATAFISNRLWLFLTVIAWLLIPIFKPVIDAEINVSAPFISATTAGDVKNILSGGAGEGGTDNEGHGKSDTSIFIITRHDTTLMLRKDTLSAAKIDTINTNVKEIKRKVSHIENATN
ncbi:hypothetical protein SNE25_21385 [Mucilaginibacter sabulilitoris]|uniref:Uncharacterized protein n=1 Tax=Mucilaginibacter sabulilitoris TaxID=1173583 RepID=A0ABZ0TFU3_9SPHI|nr:hypothetical protein [Mucilaginibacter sabulilitoris]WPU91873.1 hypothetical protein SNE25_21385 [Mucilaginibacter sabulilitoris]